MKVLLIDDDALVRAGLRMILSGAGTSRSSARPGRRRRRGRVREHRPDVVLMDIRMRGMDGRRPARSGPVPPPQVIVLTTFHADEQVLDALGPGERLPAQGHTTRDIIKAVRVVAAGEATLSPSVTRTRLSHVGDGQASERHRAAARRLSALTDREREVAAAVGSGHPTPRSRARCS